MLQDKDKLPSCFGVLDSVFPRADNGLRTTPESCFECLHKTDCLRAAITGKDGGRLKEELVDRAYESGLIGFFERWSRKKNLHYESKFKKKVDNEID